MQVKGKAKLIRYTADPEQTIALAAKLCYSGDEIDELIEKIGEKDNAKFITLLTQMNHFSPFEHASFTFALEGVSRALLAQITRHRIASFSVRSKRYVSEGEFNYVVPPAIEALGNEAVNKYESQMAQMLAWYREWQEVIAQLQVGIPVEEGLREFGKRSGVEEIQSFARTVEVCKRSEGDIAKVMENTIDLLQERMEIQMELKVILAKKKTEQKILNVMPFVVIGLLLLLSPDYLEPLYDSLQGKLVMTICMVLSVVSYAVSKKISNIAM